MLDSNFRLCEDSFYRHVSTATTTAEYFQRARKVLSSCTDLNDARVGRERAGASPVSYREKESGEALRRHMSKKSEREQKKKKPRQERRRKTLERLRLGNRQITETRVIRASTGRDGENR